MLSVSAAMLVSSTFAWFSMNKRVTAQTMSVTAKSADPYLKISAKENDFVDALYTSGENVNWQIQSTIGTGETPAAAKLKLIAPKAISSGGAVSWVWNKSTNPANPNAQSVASDSVGNVDVALTNGTAAAGTANETYRSYLMTGTVNSVTDPFVLRQELTFKNISPTGDGSKLAIKSVTITDSNTSSESDFYKAARVLIVGSDGKYALYDYEGLVTGTALYGMTGTAMSVESIAAEGAAAANMPVITNTLAANGGTYGITVYMYFDGNDERAFTNNAFDLNAVSASFEFVMADETSTL